jgi:DNA polymerase-1
MGRPINALLGAVNILLRAAADRSPRAIVICFGAEAAEYRVELYPPYHADRPPVPDDLDWQFQQSPGLFEAFGWSAVTTSDLEADDLLGSLASAESEAGGETLILTGDRDMFQCASDRVSVMLVKPGTSGFEQVDPGSVKERYGIPPELVPDFIALRGDPSDGLPGAPGIGSKTAANLLREYGSLESAIEHASDQRPRIAASLTDNAEQLRHFKDIATLRIVEMERPLDRPTDLAGGAEAAKRFGMNQLAGRLEKAETVSDL